MEGCENPRWKDGEPMDPRCNRDKDADDMEAGNFDDSNNMGNIFLIFIWFWDNSCYALHCFLK